MIKLADILLLAIAGLVMLLVIVACAPKPDPIFGNPVFLKKVGSPGG
jgi:hypothetical protein